MSWPEASLSTREGTSRQRGCGMQDRKLNDLPINDLISTIEFVQLIFESREHAIENYDANPQWAKELASALREYFLCTDTVDLRLFAKVWAQRSLFDCVYNYMNSEVSFLRVGGVLSDEPEVMVIALGYLPEKIDDRLCWDVLDYTSRYLERRLTDGESRVLEVLMKGIPKMRRMAWRWT